jgi:hypothetical protein
VVRSVRGIDQVWISYKKAGFMPAFFVGVSHPALRKGPLCLGILGPPRSDKKISTGAELPLTIGYYGAAG